MSKLHRNSTPYGSFNDCLNRFSVIKRNNVHHSAHSSVFNRRTKRHLPRQPLQLCPQPSSLQHPPTTPALLPSGTAPRSLLTKLPAAALQQILLLVRLFQGGTIKTSRRLPQLQCCISSGSLHSLSLLCHSPLSKMTGSTWMKIAVVPCVLLVAMVAVMYISPSEPSTQSNNMAALSAQQVQSLALFKHAAIEDVYVYSGKEEHTRHLVPFICRLIKRHRFRLNIHQVLPVLSFLCCWSHVSPWIDKFRQLPQCP
jgi:hypothetical protein